MHVILNFHFCELPIWSPPDSISSLHAILKFRLGFPLPPCLGLFAAFDVEYFHFVSQWSLANNSL